MYVHLYKYLCHCPNKFGSANTAQTQAFHLLLFYPQSFIRMHKKLDKSYGYISTKLLIYLFIYFFRDKYDNVHMGYLYFPKRSRIHEDFSQTNIFLINCACLSYINARGNLSITVSYPY